MTAAITGPLPAVNMTPAEEAAWVEMARDGSLSRYAWVGGTKRRLGFSRQDDGYLAVLRQRAAKFEAGGRTAELLAFSASDRASIRTLADANGAHIAVVRPPRKPKNAAGVSAAGGGGEGDSKPLPARQFVAPRKAPPQTTCEGVRAHRWRLEEPHGPTTTAVCVHCKATREYVTAPECTWVTELQSHRPGGVA